jgi:hypothetical protein
MFKHFCTSTICKLCVWHSAELVKLTSAVDIFIKKLIFCRHIYEKTDFMQAHLWRNKFSADTFTSKGIHYNHIYTYEHIYEETNLSSTHLWRNKSIADTFINEIIRYNHIYKHEHIYAEIYFLQTYLWSTRFAVNTFMKKDISCR